MLLQILFVLSKRNSEWSTMSYILHILELFVKKERFLVHTVMQCIKKRRCVEGKIGDWRKSKAFKWVIRTKARAKQISINWNAAYNEAKQRHCEHNAGVSWRYCLYGWIPNRLISITNYTYCTIWSVICHLKKNPIGLYDCRQRIGSFSMNLQNIVFRVYSIWHTPVCTRFVNPIIHGVYVKMCSNSAYMIYIWFSFYLALQVWYFHEYACKCVPAYIHDSMQYAVYS